MEHQPVGSLDIAPVAHTGTARLGARVRPGWFAQTHHHPELVGKTLRILDVSGGGVGTPVRTLTCTYLDANPFNPGA